MALLLGAFSVLALPPLYLVFMLLPAFTGLVWLIDGGSARDGPEKGPEKGAEKGPKNEPRRWRRWFASAPWSAFCVGWWFGVGHFLAGLHWLALAFLVDAEQFAWLIPFALLGLAAGLALFTAATALLTLVTSREGPARPLMLAIWWVVFEWIRGWIFTGFPWNLMGGVWGFSVEIIQSMSVFGVLGLSLLTVALAALPALFGYRRFGARRAWTAVLVGIGLLGAVWAGGAWRLAGALDQFVPGVLLRLVQPNVAQQDKWKPELRARHLRRLVRMSRERRAGAAPTHVIWPETAVPLFLNERIIRLAGLADLIAPGGALITGAPRRSRRDTGPRLVWNSIYVVDSDGSIHDTYDKFHLVPFGEYVPFRKFLSFSKITVGRSDFSPGPGRTLLDIPGAPPASPLICYEAIFSGRVTPPEGHGKQRPGWLLNLTNDAWFGMSAGPFQHFANVRLRAVEEGLPLVRVANTGISGVIDAYGRIKAVSSLGEAAIIDAALPAALEEKTIYARFGLWGVIILMLIFWLIARKFSLYSVSPILT